MSIKITDGKLEGIQQRTTKNMGGSFKKLRFLVMHYTAGTSLEGTVKHFEDPRNQVSAHFVIGRDGQIVQMVSCEHIAWHAGRDSEWRPSASPFTIKHLNFFSLGIELVNAGPLTRTQDGKFHTWSGKNVEPAEVIEVDPSVTGSFGKKFWHRYPEEQIASALDVAAAVVDEYDLEEILGHSDICPGRKTDPGPVFPMQSFRSALSGRA